MAALIGAVVLSLTVVNFLFPRTSRGEATLLLAFENDGHGRMFVGEVVEDMSILDALAISADAGQIEFKYIINSDNKLRIMELDSYISTLGDKKISFYLNNHKIDEGSIHLIAIKASDIIEVDLE